MAAGQGQGCNVGDWMRRSESNLSTRSDTVIDMPLDGRRSPDESVSLRFRNIRRNPMDPAKRNAAVAAGVVLLVIGVVTFAGVYSSFGPGSDKPLGSVALPYSDTTAVVLGSDQLKGNQPLLETLESPSAAVSRGSKPLKTTEGHIFVPERQKQDVPASLIAKSEDPTTQASVRLRNESGLLSSELVNKVVDVPTTTVKPKTKKKKSTIPHHRRTLPANASTKPPISLLYQMKLIPSVERINDFMNFTQCEHHFDDKKLFKGWRATMSVNATIAQINESRNTFIGYGKNKNLAKLMAAQYALMEIYPRNLTYTIDDDAVGAIKPYCDDNDEGN